MLLQKKNDLLSLFTFKCSSYTIRSVDILTFALPLIHCELGITGFKQTAKQME